MKSLCCAGCCFPSPRGQRQAEASLWNAGTTGRSLNNEDGAGSLALESTKGRGNNHKVGYTNPGKARRSLDRADAGAEAKTGGVPGSNELKRS